MLSSHSIFRLPVTVKNEPTVIIRYAEVRDAAQIARVAITTSVETYGDAAREVAESLYDNQYINNIFPKILADKNNIIAVLQLDDSIVGYAKLTMQDEGIALLDKLYVLNAHHRKGYGKGLLQFCYQKALELGSTSGKLLVYDKNITAIAFYEKNGFAATGEVEEYLLPDGSLSGVTNLVMRAENIENILRGRMTVTPMSQA